MCVWEGNAEVRLKFEKLNESPLFFNLNTHQNFIQDTVIDKYKIALLELNPYPFIGIKHSQKLYKVRLVINKD